MKNTFRHVLPALAMIALIVSPIASVRADDTEIYIGSNLTSKVLPNVTFIFDTSGSMDTKDVEVPIAGKEWDPLTDWSADGSCDATRIYWSSKGTPPTCTSSKYVNASVNKCADSQASLGSVAGATGYYVGTLARYRNPRRGKNTWSALSSRNHIDSIECKADYGIDGDGVDTSKLYPADEANGGPWTSDSTKAINWNGTGGNYTLYSGNYLNWYNKYGSGATTTYDTRINVVKAAFKDLVDSTSGINAALMRFDANGEGGYFVAPMKELNSTTRSTLKTAVEGFSAGGSTPLAETLYEASLFYQGKSVDYGDSSSPGTNVSGVLDSSDTSKYKSPIEYQCQKNFVVLLTDGEPTSDTSADSNIESLPGFSTITGSSSCSGDCLDELSKWMYKTDLIDPGLNDKQNVYTYTIGLKSNQTLLSNTAKNGGGKYYVASSSSDLANAFTSIITNVLAVNTTFIAPAVTVNAFNRLTHRDDMYFSVFLPGGEPDWRGNVKHYKLSGDPAIIVDANGDAAIDASTGFFSGTATSLWTLSADAPDGNNVAIGGAAGLLPTSRNLYTDTDGATLDTFNESNTSITATMVGMPSSTSAADLSKLIQWARGVDIFDSDEDSDTTDSRRQIGDILHSKPVLMTYGGTDANPDITLFVGDNEGFLHAIDAIDGTEQFGFIPKELLPNLNTLYTDSSSDKHPYGMDGPISLWHNDVNGDRIVLNTDGSPQTNEFVYLYAGMRRGGNSYYAMDVTDRSAPTLKWQITGGSSSFTELGQTWSRPVVTKIKLAGVDKNVLIFGGGYDTDEDSNTTPISDTIGRAIYMVDASTGKRIWWASSDAGADLILPKMTNSIPSDVTVLDLNNDGYADRLYVGDMGGRIWRIDFNDSNTGASTLASGGLLAELAGTDAANTRRFYYAPDVALIQGDNGYALTVSIGSGYRAHPLNQTVHDRFYMIRDDSAFGPPADTNADGKPDYPDYTEADLYDATANDLGQATGSALTTAQTAFNKAQGWYIRLVGADGKTYEGEKVLASSVTLKGQVSFTTFKPVATAQADSCEPSAGTGTNYLVNLLDATPTGDLVADGDINIKDRAIPLTRTGIPPEPTVIFTPDGQTVQCVGTECTKVDPKGLTKKSYWRQIQ